MKICILTPRFPFPENGGDVLRINAIARYLKKQGHYLLLLSLKESSNKECNCADFDFYDKVVTVRHKKIRGIIGALRTFLFSKKPLQCGYYHSKHYLRALNDIIIREQPSLFIAHLLRMAPYLERESLQDKSIVEMTDALSVTYSLSNKAKGFSIKKSIYKVESERIAAYEKHVISSFRKVVLVSLKDVDYFRNKFDDLHHTLYCYTNGVEIKKDYSSKYNPDKICFVGNMRTLQNQDAILYYINDVFPKILKSRPNSKLYIVGAQPPYSIQKLASPNIVVTGFVESIYDVISDACYVIAPIRIAAGIQNKVLFAMSYHIPVVMTSLISRAIPEIKKDENCFLADSAEDFIRYGLELSSDGVLRERIADNGYKMVKTHYSWEECLAGYEFLPHR